MRGRLLRETVAALSGSVLQRAGIAQLVELHLAKVDVAGSSPVSRSKRLSAHILPEQLVRRLRYGGHKDRWVAQKARQAGTRDYVVLAVCRGLALLD